MMYIQEHVSENDTCSRCGRKTRILSNGLCSRCDDVLYGRQPQKDYSPWYPKQRPPIMILEHPPKIKQYMCLSEKI